MFSCTKQRFEKIEYDWRLVRISKIKEATHHEEWHFKDGVIIMIEYPKDTTFVYPDTLAVGNYEYDKEFTTAYVVFSNLGDKRVLYNGRWRILKVNKEILILFKKDDRGWFYREFVKI